MNMTKLTKRDYFEGRKLRKSMERQAKKEAIALLDGSLGQGTSDLADARAIMSTYHWMKSKYMDSLLIQKGMLSGWHVLLAFADLPRGIPNMLGAPGKPKSREEAEAEAFRMLRAAYVKCEETKMMMREGIYEDLRLFRCGEVFLQVPGGMVDAAAKKIPAMPEESEAQKLRKQHIDSLSAIIKSKTLTEEAWSALSEDLQIQAMVDASFLLCLNINRV